MRSCYEKDFEKYKNYGARGIYVCDDWHDAQVFRIWCLENGIQEDLQIDRINNDGPYSPDNCRFVSSYENMNNRRNTKRYYYKGNLISIRDFCNLFKLQFKIVRGRIRRKKQDLDFDEYVKRYPIEVNDAK